MFSNRTDSSNLQSFLRQIIGHVSPEAAQRGPIAFVEQDDLIELDIQNRTLSIIGVKGEPKSLKEINEVFANRKTNWKPRKEKYPSGVLHIYTHHAVSPMSGGYME